MTALTLWDAPARSPLRLLASLSRTSDARSFASALTRILCGAGLAFAALYLTYDSIPGSMQGAFSILASATFLGALIATALLRA